MDLSKLHYSKNDSEKTSKEIVPKSSPRQVASESIIDVPHIPSVYKKPESTISTNLIFVLSGGEKKEKDFLKELIKKEHSLRVVFLSKEGQGLQPYQMQEIWQGIKHNDGIITISSQTYHLEVMDRVFLLSDVDEFYQQLLAIGCNGPDSDEQWIISNPCFEMWLLYCYRDSIKEIKELESLPESSRSKRLKALGQELVPGGMNPCLAFEQMLKGIENSKQHYSVDENGVPKLYATQMHHMAQYIVDTMNKNDNEFKKFIDYQNEKRNFRKQIKK